MVDAQVTMVMMGVWRGRVLGVTVGARVEEREAPMSAEDAAVDVMNVASTKLVCTIRYRTPLDLAFLTGRDIGAVIRS